MGVLALFQAGDGAEVNRVAFEQKHHVISDFAHQVEVMVTTTLVKRKWVFNRSIRLPTWSLMMGSTMVVGSSYRIHSGCAANARAMATARLWPVDRSAGYSSR